MKLRTIERLDLIAATRHQKVLDEVRRHSATLDSAAQQRQVLENYRTRLRESWQTGEIVTAAEAQRAGHFVRASDAAEAQILRTEQNARRMLDAALRKLADSQAHRDGLDEAARKATLTQDRLAAQRAELALPGRNNVNKEGRS
jgi:flagellar biosynthesis chaperone FliJ